MIKGKEKVAIQGIRGSFHHLGATLFFGENIEVVECEWFDDVLNSVNRRESDFGIIAIENTVAGSILDNYRLLLNSGRKIIEELYLRIEQNLACLPDVSIGEIKEVYSHPMAISQCRMFFEKYPHIKLIEQTDTAESAKLISELNDPAKGVICSEHAAEIYNLQILKRGIETHKRNFTRFLIVSNDDTIIDKEQAINKASLSFTISHEVGSLSKVLSIFSYYGLNLTKIQSLPIIGKEWQYQFYVDLTFPEYSLYNNAIDAIIPLTDDFVVMGEYPVGKLINSGSNTKNKYQSNKSFIN